MKVFFFKISNFHVLSMLEIKYLCQEFFFIFKFLDQ